MTIAELIQQIGALQIDEIAKVLIVCVVPYAISSFVGFVIAMAPCSIMMRRRNRKDKGGYHGR